MNAFIIDCQKLVIAGELVYLFKFFIQGKGIFFVPVLYSELETTKDISEAKTKGVTKFKSIYDAAILGNTTPTPSITFDDHNVVFE